MESADEFIRTLDIKTHKKLFQNIRIAEQTNNPKFFKKLNKDIWEFRVRFSNTQVRLLAFWDKRNSEKTLVIATNGFIKKTQKTPTKGNFKSGTNNETIFRGIKIKVMAKMKTYSLSEMEDKYIGKKGTKEREQYEYELRMDLLGQMIRTTRKEKNLTQEKLGELIGVNKSQISKLENNTNSATIETIIRVFKALKAEINFNVILDNKKLEIA